jgi:hypothetical protein
MDLYFRVSPTSPLMEEVKAFKKHTAVRNKAVTAFEKKHCLPRTDGYVEQVIVWGHGGLAGLKVSWDFEANKKRPEAKKLKRTLGEAYRILPRVGWRWNVKDEFNKPDLRTPEGKAIAAEMKAVPLAIDQKGASARIFGHDAWGVKGEAAPDHGFRLEYAHFCWDKKNVYVIMDKRVKKAATIWPEGLIEVTGGEVAHLVEG